MTTIKGDFIAMVCISYKDVTNVLRGAIEGRITIHLHPDEKNTWADGIEAPNISFLIDGWKIALFNDCVPDYIVFAVSPKGERIGDDDRRYVMDPHLDSMLSREELAQLENLLYSARWP